ncbi:MAG TPA: hypothetical protein VK469_14595 [Candidatus Kapabacteria bacterium]|nr:hypothetical protein [Candidatus Kapabacteria bacterium]
MKKLILLLIIEILIVTGWLFPVSDFKLEKDVTLPSNETSSHSIVSLKGKLDIKGSVKESVLLVGGNLMLDGVVAEDVICISSRVTIGKNAVIKRDLFVIGGSLEKDPGAKVEGEFFYFKFDLKRIENTIIPILSDTRTFTLFKTVNIIIWFIIALIVFAVVPQKINFAEEIFDNHRLKIGVIGLLALFSFIFLLFISIILSFIIIGIPLFIALILLCFITYIFGRTVVFYFIGIKLTQLVKLKAIPPASFILAGAILYALLKFLPILGPILLVILNIFEFGIGVGYFFRKKLEFDK